MQQITSAAAMGVPPTGIRPGVSTDGGQVCDASKYRHLIGKPFRHGERLPKVHRVYLQYTPISKDCRSDRLNVELAGLVPEGYEGRIVTDVWCG
ncbi:hypothetical protein ABZ070_34765 [Streptomyces sp. NPDC006283]|uniref:hypothetical protein n=1 Tax=Streptomyces sp. NPDC006283 TaxID=3156741 RepID=UPI0033BB6E6B